MSKNKKFIVAYFWNLLGKFTIRGMGIVSTLVLVRLLSPDDFGLVAISTMFIGFFTVLTNAGINRYLILQESLSDNIYHSAWTLNLILRAIALMLVFVSAVTISDYMQDDRLVFVIQAAGVVGFIDAFKSIELVKLEKAINFGAINKIQIIAKVFAITATISSAIYYRSYLALIIGNLVSTTCVVVMSYWFTNAKLKVNFNFDRKMFTFSSQIFLRNIVGYSRSQVDTLLVGRYFDTAQLGQFAISKQFAILPQSEIISPAMQPAFSLLSSIKNSKELFFTKVYQALFFIYIFVVPAAVGLFVLADSFVMAVLGPQWIAAADYIGVLAFLMLPFSTQPIFNTIYDAEGKTKLSLFADLFGLASIILLCIIFEPLTLSGFIDLRILVGILALLLSVGLIKVFVGFDLQRYFLILLLPTLSAAIMGCILNAIYYELYSPFLTLAVFALLGFILYASMTVFLFYALVSLRPKSWILSLIPSFVYQRIEYKFQGWLEKKNIPVIYYRFSPDRLNEPKRGK